MILRRIYFWLHRNKLKIDSKMTHKISSFTVKRKKCFTFVLHYYLTKILYISICFIIKSFFIFRKIGGLTTLIITCKQITIFRNTLHYIRNTAAEWIFNVQHFKITLQISGKRFYNMKCTFPIAVQGGTTGHVKYISMTLQK